MKIASRAILTIGLIVSWIFFLWGHHKKAEFRHQIESLNVAMPGSFRYLLDIEKLKQVDLRGVNRYINFYQKIADYFPQQADAHGMLGFCYYFMGDRAKAIVSYEEAIKNRPDYFWFHYNLGVIYLQGRDYPRASALLEKAIKTNPDGNLQYLFSSRVVYRTILDEMPQGEEEVKQRLARGYQQAYMLLILNSYRLGNYAAMLNYAESAILSKIGRQADFFYLSSVAAAKLKDYEKAAYYLERSIAVDKDNAYVARLLPKIAEARKGRGFSLTEKDLFAVLKIGDPHPVIF